MSYGVELINNRNYIVANANDVNYILRSAGQITNGHFYNNGASDISKCSMDVGAFDAPLLFFASTNSNQRFCQIPGGAGNDTLFLLPGQVVPKRTMDIYKWWNLDCGTVQYYIFDRWIPPERSNYGLQIFDGGGGIIFDGGWYFLKINNVIWLDPGYPNHSGSSSGSNWTQIGGLSGGNLAVSMPNTRFWDIAGGAAQSWRLGECIHLDGGNTQLMCSLTITGKYLDQGPVNGGWANQASRSQIMVADVSQLPTTYNPVAISRF